MKNVRTLILTAICLVLVVLSACSSTAQPTTPAPTTTPAPKPSTSVAVSPTPTASVSPTATSKPTSTPTAAPASFAGKTITLVAPGAAGSGQDIVARLYSIYLKQLLPGNPNVIVRDMPAAGGIEGPNYVYRSKPDGLTLLVTAAGNLTSQLLGLKAVQYDLFKMRAYSAYSDTSVYVIKAGIISKPQDLLKANGIVFGCATGLATQFAVSAKEVLNFPVKTMTISYSGAAEPVRALLAGEINMTYTTTQVYNTQLAPLVAKGEIMPVFQLGLIDDKGKIIRAKMLPPDILTTDELYKELYGKEPSGVGWEAYKFVFLGKVYQQLTLTPPGTPDNIVQAYDQAFTAMIKDPAFMETAKKTTGSDLWKAGASLDKEVKQNLVVKPEIREWLRNAMAKYGAAVE